MKYFTLKHLLSEGQTKMSHERSQMLNKKSQGVSISPKYLQQCALKKTKRSRIAFSTEQINYLEKEFKKFPYIGSANRKELAHNLNITERAVKIWFQNRRMREKKDGSNKEFDTDEHVRDIPLLTNQQLNNVHNLSLNNDQGCFSGELMRPSSYNRANESITKTSNCGNIGNNQKLCSPNEGKPNGYVGVTNNLVSKNILINKYFDFVKVPVPERNVTKDAKRVSMGVSKEKNICVPSTKRQEKGLRSNCSSVTRNLNMDQDMAQDLSSKGNLNLPPTHFYPITSLNSSFLSLHTQNPYVPPILPPSNIIWKPVPMPSLAGLTTPLTMTIPQQSAASHPGNENSIKDCSCFCYCLDPVRGFNQVTATAQPQYILAIPLNNPSK